MHKCIAGFPDAVGYRRVDPSARQRRSPLFAAPIQPSLSLSLSLSPPLSLSLFRHRLPYPASCSPIDYGVKGSKGLLGNARVYLMTRRRTGGVFGEEVMD
jgi:hypothetical protein